MNELVGDSQQQYVSHSNVEAKDLPFHCPPDDVKQWNMHPKVFIQFDDKGKGTCPYCGAKYELI